MENFFFLLVLSVLGLVLLWIWSVKNKIILIEFSINWTILFEKLFDNLVFSVLFTALLTWLQFFVTSFFN